MYKLKDYGKLIRICEKCKEEMFCYVVNGSKYRLLCNECYEVENGSAGNIESVNKK